MARYTYFVDKETQQQIGMELWKIRRDKRLQLRNVESQTHIPANLIERIEIGRNLNYSIVRRLITFYGKKMKVVFEDEQTSESV